MPHAYWRIYVTANSSGTNSTEVAEVQFRAAAGGADQATGGTAIQQAGSTGVAARAFDDSTATYWTDSTAYPKWVGYHFAAPVSVAEVAITSGGTSSNWVPNTFTVDYSDDGVTWVTLASFAGQTWTGNLQTRTFAVPAEGGAGRRKWVIILGSRPGRPTRLRRRKQ